MCPGPESGRILQALKRETAIESRDPSPGEIRGASQLFNVPDSPAETTAAQALVKARGP
jgi:hypothetical protein